MVPHGRWWLEWEIWLLTLLAGTMYLTRLEDTEFRGEESRRGQVAREMLVSGDWLVPQQQGKPFLSRPPMQNWLIALTSMIRGQLDKTAVRLPSGIAILLIVVLVYGYCRTFLSRLGALAGTAAFATMGHVLLFGRLGETEAMYMLFVSASLLLWHWADSQGKPALWAWCGGYAFAAIGMLTKGPQAPVYFVGGVGAFLLLKGRWREIFRWPHWVGLLVFLAGWGVWQIPFFLHVGSDQAWRMLSGDIGARYDVAGWHVFFQHLVTYPIEVAVCMLPWSLLLPAYLWRGFRRAIGPANENVQFLACCIVAAFLICWLTPGARNRYFAPLFPCFGCLTGLVVERCCSAITTAAWAGSWRRYVRGTCITMPILGIWVLAATVLGWSPLLLGAQPPVFVGIYVLSVAVLGLLTFWSTRHARHSYRRIEILCVTVFLGLTFTGVIQNAYVARRRPITESVAQLKERLPIDVRLVSIGVVDHGFTFHYADPIRQLPSEGPDVLKDADWTYFCAGFGESGPKCDFPYEEVAVILCDPEFTPHPKRMVTIGRRIGTSYHR